MKLRETLSLVEEELGRTAIHEALCIYTVSKLSQASDLFELLDARVSDVKNTAKVLLFVALSDHDCFSDVIWSPPRRARKLTQIRGDIGLHCRIFVLTYTTLDIKLFAIRLWTKSTTFNFRSRVTAVQSTQLQVLLHGLMED